QLDCAPRDLDSFPTRRSSDLANGQQITRLGELTAALKVFSAQTDVLPRLGCIQDLNLVAFSARVLLHHNGICPGRQGSARKKAQDRKSTRLNSSHSQISYAVF